MEILNLLVGLELIALGFIYLLMNDISSAASWSIFGCMYIVMDKYSVLGDLSKTRKFIEGVKYTTAWLALGISTTFLVYVILTALQK